MSGQLEDIPDTESDTSFYSTMSTMQDEVPSANIYLESRIRRSLSLNSLVTIPENSEITVDSLLIQERRPASRAYNHKKAPSQELINKLAQPKRFTSAENLTLAEAVRKFQIETPKRFRSCSSPPNPQKFSAISWERTKAQIPKLMTKQRARPTHIISHEEREKLEAEEAKMFKIKAHPINKKVMKGPMNLPPVEKKAPTAIESFKLTKVKKCTHFQVQKIPPFKEKPHFKDLQNPFKLQTNSQLPTVPQTPSFVKKLNKNLPKIESHEKIETDLKPFKPSVTQPQPFSFEEREKVMQKKKEELVKRILEEEKKAREFHAKPPPKAILRDRNKNVNDVHFADAKQKGNVEIDTISTFKAKSSTVLRVEPFQLSTDHRAHSRQKFENSLKEKENEELAKKREEQEVAQLRTEEKAQPIKKKKRS